MGAGTGPDALELPLRKSKAGWAFAVVGLAVLALGATGAWFYLQGEGHGDPTRVLVVMHGGLEPGLDGPLLRSFGRRLGDHGFDVVVDEEMIDGAHDAALFEARRRALEVDAGHAVLLELSVDQERAGIVDGHHLYRARLATYVVATDPGQEVGSDELEFAFEGASAMLVASGLQNTWIDTLAPGAIERLHASPTIAAIVSGEEPVAMERMPFATELRDGQVAVDERRARIERWERVVSEGRAQVASSNNAESGVRCFGDPSRPWSVVGFTGDGENVVVQEHYRTPIFGFIDTGNLRWIEPPESLLVVALSDPTDSRALMRVGHFYSVSTSSNAGRHVTGAFFGSGVPAVVTLDVESGDWSQRWLLEEGERVGWGIASSDGRAILAHRRQAGWGVFTGNETIDMPDVRHPAFVQVGDAQRIVGQLDDGRVAVMDSRGAPLEPFVPLEGRLERVLSRGDAVSLLSRQGRSCSLTSFDVASRALGQPVALPLCLDDAALLPDGRLVGVGFYSAPGDPPGDTEIVLVDPTTQVVTALTRGSQRDEMLRLSPDGGRVVFNRRFDEWPRGFNLRLFRRAVCTLEIPD